MEADALPRELAELPARLRHALSAADLIAATSWAADAEGVTEVSPHLIWVGAQRLTSPIPSVRLTPAGGVDARSLCRSWKVPRPVALSADVHQTRWEIQVGGAELPDPHQRRIASAPLVIGCWEVRIHLAGRPTGPLPALVSGASPAYDVVERGGLVTWVEVSRARFDADVVTGADPAARELLRAMAGTYPVWRTGWTAQPADEVALVLDVGRPIAGAVITISGPVAEATRLSVLTASGWTGHQLLELLEALAMSRGCRRLILDSSAFLHPGLPYRQLGYTVQPPYQGDPEAPVWVQRDLTEPP